MDERKRLRGMLRLLPVVAAVAVLAAGCYTVVSHPASMQVTAAGSSDSHGGDLACGECHVESEWLGYFDHPLIYGSAGYYGYDWWYDYYQRPWWFDDYWYGDGGGSGAPGEGGRLSWTKRPDRRGDELYPSTETSGPQLSPGTVPSSGPSVGASGQGAQPTKQEPEPAPASSYGKKKRNPRR